jgi:hypothetical protein
LCFYFLLGLWANRQHEIKNQKKLKKLDNIWTPCIYYFNSLLYNIVCSNDYDIQYCMMYVYTMFVHFN